MADSYTFNSFIIESLNNVELKTTKDYINDLD